MGAREGSANHLPYTSPSKTCDWLAPPLRPPMETSPLVSVLLDFFFTLETLTRRKHFCDGSERQHARKLKGTELILARLPTRHHVTVTNHHRYTTGINLRRDFCGKRSLRYWFALVSNLRRRTVLRHRLEPTMSLALASRPECRLVSCPPAESVWRPPAPAGTTQLADAASGNGRISGDEENEHEEEDRRRGID